MAQPPLVITQYTPYRLVLNVESIGLTDEQLLRLFSDNPELRFELSAQKELIIMPPTGMTTGWRNAKLTQRLGNWAETDGSGLVFDSSTLFTLPNGAKRSPDAAWVMRERWEGLTEEQQERFGPLCPDFVVELRSPSDSLPDLQDKMVEYIANGSLLGWLLDPINKGVYVYRPGQLMEYLEAPATISGDPVLPGFVFSLLEIW